jgi:hypothetical protein
MGGADPWLAIQPNHGREQHPFEPTGAPLHAPLCPRSHRSEGRMQDARNAVAVRRQRWLFAQLTHQVHHFIPCDIRPVCVEAATH